MKKIFTLMMVIAMLLTLAACGTSAENSPSQNESSEQISTPQIENTPDSASVIDNDLSGADESTESENDAIANTSITSQPKSKPNPAPQSESTANKTEETNVIPNISITVGGSVFSAKLYDNSAARAFLSQFPLTLNMSDLNGNEKYYYLSDDLPSESTEKPATMNPGDLMCWSGNCLVLFYKGFSNSYGGYVRLGYIEDASGLATALGNGNAEVMFSVKD